MRPERWRQITEVFHAALAREAHARVAFLADACGEDSGLRAEVDALLAAHERAPDSSFGFALSLPEPAAALSPGASLASYRISALLGAGGMGEVYRAHDTRLQRDVAIKVLPARAVAVAEAGARLLREARLASQLNHPNICTIHEVGEAAGRAFIVMELVEGQALSVQRAGGPLPSDTALRYATQLAEGLAHAHARGIVHRDLKSANIIITSEGRVKILDFGLAKRLMTAEPAAVTATRDTLTQPGIVAGTIAYMAPELFRGFPADVRSDIWALGVVMYEMCAGRRPFRGRTDVELGSAILHDEPAPLPATSDARLEPIIVRCLEKDPAARIQRAADVRAALEAMSAGAPATASRRAARLRLAVLPLENLSGDAAQDYLVDGMHEALITDLARINSLRVIARSSVLRYRGGNHSLRQVGEQLNVDLALAGSVMRIGDRVRITAQLLRTADEEHVWAGRYDRNLRDVLSMQSEIVTAIAREIHVQLLPEEQARLSAARPVNSAAHEAYLKGSFQARKFGPGEFDTALQYYRLAIDIDPDYALPYAGMAMVWLSRLVMGIVPPGEAGLLAKADAARAIELDDTSADAYTTLANISCSVDWDWAASERHYLRAIDLNPSCAEAHLFYGHLLTAVGRFAEARSQLDLALELDPFNSFFQGLYGFHLVWVRQIDAAVAQFEAALRTTPQFVLAHRGLFTSFVVQGRHEEALSQAQAMFEAVGDREIVGLLERGYAEGGFSRALATAADALAARAAGGFVKPFTVAVLYDYSGDTERALEWLERSFVQRDHDLMYLSVAPFTERSRATPGFQNVLQRMNLPSLPAVGA